MAAKGHRARNQAGAALQINLYGEINTWSVRDIVMQLQAAPEAQVLLRINSPGGDVTEGFALANVLRSHSGRKVALIEGVCASAATFPACACDQVQMHPESLFMIHAPWGLTEGGAEDMESYASVLEKMATLCVGLYQRKTGATEEQVRAWIKAETWMTPQEAKAAGFCDEILDAAAPPSARARAARYLARVRSRKDPSMAKANENEEPMNDGEKMPEHLRAKLAKCGMGEDPDHDAMMTAYMTYMSTSDDSPAERMEMRKCMERMKMADDDEEESSADKSGQMNGKLRAGAGLDPAVAKLVDNLTAANASLTKRLDGFESKERTRAEREFYENAAAYASREDAQEYLALCDGDFGKATKLIQKLPRKAGPMGRWFAGGSPIGGGGTSAGGAKDAPVEKTKTVRVSGSQVAHLHGYALAAHAKKIAKERNLPLGQAQIVAARERPDLLQN